MKRVYTSENRFQVDAMRTHLESHGVPTMLRNEYTSSIMGEVPFFDTWPELWVPDDWEPQAKRLLAQIEVQLTAEPSADWECQTCKEENPSTFELCWNCQMSSGASFKA